MLYNMVITLTDLDRENKRITDKYLKNQREALVRRSLKIKQVEHESQLKFAHELPKPGKDALLWLGLGLYWAEGAKTERWRAVFYNADPDANRVMMRFFREICGMKNDDLRIQLVLHEHVIEQRAKRFWSTVLDLPVKNFFHASYVKSKSSKGKRPYNRLPFGTVQISVRGKKIANKIRGWLIGVKKRF